MRIFCWVRAISSRWTELTSSSCSRPRSRSRVRTAISCCSLPCRDSSTAARSSAACMTERSSWWSTTRTATETACGGAALADQPLAALGGPGARLALGLGGPEQGVGATVERAGAFLGRPEREPGVHLALPGLAGGLGEPLAVGGVGLRIGDVLGRGEPGLEVGQPGEVGLPGLSRGDDRAIQALDLALGGAGLGAVLAELLGHCGEGRVGLVELGQRHVDPLEGVVADRLEPRDLEAEPLGGRGRLGEAGGGLVDGGLDLDEAGLAGGAARGEVGAEQVALAGHGHDVGQVGDQSAGGGQVVDDGDPAQQPHQRGAYVVGRGDHVDGVGHTVGQAGPVAVVEGCTAEDEPRATEVVVLEVADRVDGGSGVGDHDRVGRAAEGGRHGGLVAVLDVEQRGDRAEETADLVGGRQERAGAVLAVEADLERVAARDQPGPVAVGLLGVLAGPGELLVDLVEGSDRVLVLGVEALLAGIEAGDAGLERGEVALRALGAGDGVLAGVGEPPDLGVGRLGARLQRVDLAGQAGQALASVGGGPLEAGDPPLLLGGGLLGRALRDDRRVEDLALLLDLLGDLRLLLAHPLGLRLEVVGIAAGVDGVALGRSGGVADPLVGERRRAPQPFLEAGQGEPRLLGRGQPRQVVAQRRLEPRLLSRPAVISASTSSRRSSSTDSSASSVSSAVRAVTRSSASSRARASRTSACTVCAWRATSAWRPSGLSWRRISDSRSARRVRLPSVASSLRSAFSLRLRCFRTPAASSMKPRRSSGVACRIESSWPCPTITCISRPMPESLSSSCTSSSRQPLPLMAYSEPPLRNMVRLIVTSA